MATVVDTLVTRYTLDAQQYRQGAGQVMKDTGAIGAAMDGLLAKAKLLAPIIGAGVLGAGIAAAKSAADWDVLVRQLAVVTGSFERANKIATFAQNLAVPSAFFDTKQLADAARLLEAMNLQTERFLPLASTMASLFGADTQALMEFSSALGRIKSGQFGEAFEALRRYGVSTQLLQGQGLVFDKSGQFQGTADQALAAVENIVKTRFGNMDAIMGNSQMAKFTTILDNISIAMRKAGEQMLKAFGPVLDTAGRFASYLQKSDIIAKTLSATLKTFNINDLVKTLEDGGAYAIAVFEQLPKVIDKALERLKLLAQLLGPVARGLAELVLRTTPGFDADLVSKRAGEISQSVRINRLLDDIIGRAKGKQDAGGGTGQGQEFQSPQTQYLARIAANTDKMVDIQRSALGGSVYGEKAFNSVNIGRLTRRMSLGADAKAAWGHMFEIFAAYLSHTNTVAEQRVGR